MNNRNLKRWIIPNLPYILFVYLFDKAAQAVRLAPGADLSGKLLGIGNGFTSAFASPLPSFSPVDMLIGIAGAILIRLIVYTKGKNAKKYRKGVEYGSARWGNAEDIKPYIDPVFANNVLLTQTERLMMSSRPKQPKYARNKNILVIGGSGSGKTRFFVKPNLMQMHSSYVVTDPKGTVLVECGKLLQRGGYRIKVLNTINFKKSMCYNPFAYLRSEKDILKLVNTIIANTKGDGEKSGEDFWVKSERLFYCALIGYIWYEAPEAEKNFTTLLEMINASEAREDDPEFQSPVDLMQDVSFTPDVSRTLDSKKVSDHHAIIPTLELAKTDLAALPESERNILTLAGARLLFAAAEPHSYEAVTAVFSCADNSFTAKGKSVLCAGWKDLERRYRLTLKGKPDADDGDSDFVSDVPDFTEGQTFSGFSANVTAHDTQPPKPHTEASLLSAMEHAGSEDTNAEAERKGLGTPATRAAVIEKLVNSGFVERKGKQLFPTKNGINLICVLPDNLTSPKLTAEWENTLTLIAKGNANPEDFMQGIEAMAQELVKAYPFLSEKDKELFKEEKPVIGKCPRCGSPVHESKKNYYCSDRDCTFTMWKNDRFFEERKTVFTPKIAAALLKSGKASVKGLYSQKTGKTYDGNVVLADTGGKYVNYRVELPKKK